MQTTQRQLIDELSLLAEQALEAALEFREMPTNDLSYKKDPAKWSILECLEHLNLYGDFYLPEIEKTISNGFKVDPEKVYKAGIIGNYFANLMKAEPGKKIKKMRSPSDKDPVNSTLSPTTIDRFIKQTEKLKTLLIQARIIDLRKAKTPISISRLIRLRLGDTLRFYVYHIDRHILQAKKIISS